MANISKEEDRRDFEERLANNGNRRISGPRVETLEEAIQRTEQEVRIGLRELRNFIGKTRKL